MNTNHAETFANEVNNIISLYEDLSDNESRNKVISQFVNGFVSSTPDNQFISGTFLKLLNTIKAISAKHTPIMTKDEIFAGMCIHYCKNISKVESTIIAEKSVRK